MYSFCTVAGGYSGVKRPPPRRPRSNPTYTLVLSVAGKLDWEFIIAKDGFDSCPMCNIVKKWSILDRTWRWTVHDDDYVTVIVYLH